MIFGEDTPITLSLALAVAGVVAVVVVWISMRFRQVENKLAEHKLYAANNYATQDSVKEAVDRVVSAVDGLRQDMVARMGKLEDHWMNKKDK